MDTTGHSDGISVRIKKLLHHLLKSVDPKVRNPFKVYSL